MPHRRIDRIVIELGSQPMIRAYGQTIIAVDGEEFPKPEGNIEPSTADQAHITAATKFAIGLAEHFAKRDGYAFSLAGSDTLHTP